MKISNAEIIASSKINADILGEFTASLHRANYEFSMKSYIGAEDDWKGDDEDPRKMKHHKAVDAFSVVHEVSDHTLLRDNLENLASAQATDYARKVANVRGSEADPDFMEQQIHSLVAGNEKVREVRVIRGKQLKELGMNLHYEVGKGA